MPNFQYMETGKKDNKIRIQKYMSEIGILSRRKAEEEIKAGKIMINGRNAVLGQKINPGFDVIKYNNTIINAGGENRKLYVMLNKPAGYITTLSDDRGRKCITEFIRDIDARIYPCGRLDRDSEGLLILTNDGDFAYKLTHPGFNIPKIYHVTISCGITTEQLNALSQPMIIDDYQIKPVKITVITREKDFTVLRMALFEGRNRQIRNMCELCGLKIIHLRRIAIGDLALGDLKPGKWKFLSTRQIKYLKGIKTYARNESNTR